MLRHSAPTAILLAAGCAGGPPIAGTAETAPPPPAIRAWMDRLTVAHAYDPATGFIVAKETVALPPLLANAPPLDEAIAAAGTTRTVIAFATADRCAPCQQYKRDALHDTTVLARLASPRFLATHVEVDRAAALAEAHLGARSIPMTYALRESRVIAELRGQRSAAELAAWLDALPGA